MAKANLKKSDKYHHSIRVHTYVGGPELASIEIPPFRLHSIKFQKMFFLDQQLFFQEQKTFFKEQLLFSF